MKKISLVSSITILLLLATYFYNSHSNLIQNKILIHIKNEYSKGSNKIDFDGITNFSWDTLYCFPEEYPAFWIEEDISVKWERHYEVPSGLDLLLFVKDDVLVHEEYKKHSSSISFVSLSNRTIIKYIYGNEYHFNKNNIYYLYAE